MDKFKQLPREEAIDGLPAGAGRRPARRRRRRGPHRGPGRARHPAARHGRRLPAAVRRRRADRRRRGAQPDDEAGIPGPEQLGTRLPGTGGDFRRPSGGGELTDDTEGYREPTDPDLPRGGDPAAHRNAPSPDGAFCMSRPRQPGAWPSRRGSSSPRRGSRPDGRPGSAPRARRCAAPRSCCRSRRSARHHARPPRRPARRRRTRRADAGCRTTSRRHGHRAAATETTAANSDG